MIQDKLNFNKNSEILKTVILRLKKNKRFYNKNVYSRDFEDFIANNEKEDLIIPFDNFISKKLLLMECKCMKKLKRLCNLIL